MLFRVNLHRMSTMQKLVDHVYATSKSVISLSQSVSTQPLINNFYIHQSIPMLPPEPSHVYRLLISPNLSHREMQLSINKLKENRMMKELIQMQSDLKYAMKASRIIIDSEVYPTVDQQTKEDSLEFVEKNMVEIEKLLQVGLGLNISYMISKKSYLQSWIKTLSKKRKAISSDVVEVGKSFEETVYENGYLLEHLFLKGFKDGKECNLVEETDAFSPNELITVLNMIHFKGKLILPQIKFIENVEYLQKILKKNGYEKRSRNDFGESNWMAMI